MLDACDNAVVLSSKKSMTRVDRVRLACAEVELQKRKHAVLLTRLAVIVVVIVCRSGISPRPGSETPIGLGFLEWWNQVHLQVSRADCWQAIHHRGSWLFASGGWGLTYLRLDAACERDYWVGNSIIILYPGTLLTCCRRRDLLHGLAVVEQ